MRVFISGMSSTGKTTLINYIKDNLDIFKAFVGIKNVVFIDEIARKFFEEHNKGYSTYEKLLCNYRDCLDYSEELIDEFNNSMHDTNASNYIYIIDRAPIDYRINLTLNYTAGSSKEMTWAAEYYDNLYHRIWSTSPSDLIFMTNPKLADAGVYDDGFRPIGLQYRRHLEKSLFEMAAKDTSVILLPSSTEKRFAKVVNEINKKLEDKRGVYRGIE